MARELRKCGRRGESALRTQHLLLLSSIALSTPVLAAEPKPTANANGRPGIDANSRADELTGTEAGDEKIQNHPARKNRVRYTFPPPAKRI